MDGHLETPSQRLNRGEETTEAEDVCLREDSDDSCTSIEFLQMQKKQLIDLQDQLERYDNVLPVFGFDSAKHDNNLI